MAAAAKLRLLVAAAALLALASAPTPPKKKGNCDRSCRRKPDCKQFPRRCSGCDMCKTEAEKARDAAIAAAMERRLVPPKRNRKKEGAERLIAAVNANDAQLLRELFLELPVGAVNWGTDGGMRPLFAALQVHKVEMVEVLLGYGADTRYEIEPGYTALAAAVLWGCKECTQALIDAGANPMRRMRTEGPQKGKTALDFSKERYWKPGTKTFEERKEIDWHWSWEILLRRKLEVRAEKERALAYPWQASDLAEVGNEAPPEHLRSNKRWYHNKVNPGSRELSTWPGNLDSASVAREGTGRLKEAVGRKKWPERSPDEL